MNIDIELLDLGDKHITKYVATNIEDRNHFFYVDDEQAKCELTIYDDGVVIIRKKDDYFLNLNLRNECFASVSSKEGVIKLNIKIVDFLKNDDIVVMRYVVENQEREIKIIYRS